MSAAAVFILITLPWLNPFSPGPTSQVGPLLFSWACAAGVLVALALDRQRGENHSMVRSLVLGWGAAAALSTVIGLLQYFGQTARFGVWLNHTELGAAFGNLRQRNQFATLLNIGLVAALWLAAQQPSSSVAGRLRLPLALALAALVSVGNAASSSRTGLFQLTLILVLSLMLLARSWQRDRAQCGHVLLVLLTAVTAYVLALLALPLLAGLDPVGSGALARLRAGDAACSSRMAALWPNVLYLIAQKPWLGWGWNELDYAHFITLYPGIRFCDILDNAHNLPLHLAVELGVPVALWVCGTSLWLFWRGRPWQEVHPTRLLAWGVLAVILLHSMVEYPLWYGPFQTAAALSVWLLWWVPRQDEESVGSIRFRRLALYTYASLATLVIAYCAFATWNYRLASQIYLSPLERAPAYQDNTLSKIKNVRLYQDPVRFAELTTTDLTTDNATYVNALAKDMLHFSPEARVVELIIDSAQLQGHTAEVAFYAARFKAAFPAAYAQWVQKLPEASRPVIAP